MSYCKNRNDCSQAYISEFLKVADIVFTFNLSSVEYCIYTSDFEKTMRRKLLKTIFFKFVFQYLENILNIRIPSLDFIIKSLYKIQCIFLGKYIIYNLSYNVVILRNIPKTMRSKKLVVAKGGTKSEKNRPRLFHS